MENRIKGGKVKRIPGKEAVDWEMAVSIVKRITLGIVLADMQNIHRLRNNNQPYYICINST
jgi:hypothetical protein